MWHFLRWPKANPFCGHRLCIYTYVYTYIYANMYIYVLHFVATCYISPDRDRALLPRLLRHFTMCAYCSAVCIFVFCICVCVPVQNDTWWQNLPKLLSIRQAKSLSHKLEPGKLGLAPPGFPMCVHRKGWEGCLRDVAACQPRLVLVTLVTLVHK